jgi:tetratricopeptide (TPR) repeat protein
MLVGPSAPAAAASFEEDQRLCNGATSTDPDTRLAACSRQISSGRWRGNDLAVSYHERGIAYASKADWDHAIADQTEAIKLNPSLAAAYLSRASAFSRKGDNDLALADSNDAVRIAPKNAANYAFRGYVLNNRGE